MNKSNFENSFTFYTDNPIVFQPQDLSVLNGEMRDDLNNYNIYLITRAKRVWFFPETIDFDRLKKTVTFEIAVQNGYRIILRPIITPVGDIVHSVKVSPYPHKKLLMLDKDEKIVREFEARKMIFDMPDDIRPDYEVLYVGRSYGTRKKLNVTDRLYKQDHKKFKQILIDTISDFPSHELFIFTLSYNHSKNNVMMNSKGPKDLNEEEFRRFDYLRKLTIARREKVNLVEEALINYFDPEYNKQLRESLSKLSSKTIQYFQELDISGITVELSCNEANIKLSSRVVPPKVIHLFPFATFKNKSRFDFATDSDIKEARERNTDYLLELMKT